MKNKEQRRRIFTDESLAGLNHDPLCDSTQYALVKETSHSTPLRHGMRR
ncbi:hypothetical protein GQF59_25505 [Escherichia coli]|nr:hypothetical protein [Escherichia coli]